ncbi:hypothetical protein FEM48_Zijuj02G0034400 [Ziziphus jujuba var. spinosa]|uniref:Lysosomal Pro-X carboxypeptidase-like n=1 Tax=Ziziphus jujuba var. spinosa TaxID=714518 RepID=A0A978VTC5_ZIZJJ|nr:hypothetical protein FEM48_Zijuj02G0034400 [Ziziphus jujuba var. spinosa]
MNSLLFSCQLLLISLFILSSDSASDEFNLHFPKPIRGVTPDDIKTMYAPLSDDYEILYYNQTVDHFNYRPLSYTSFKQKYVINSKHWGGSPAPVFVYFGAEARLTNGTVTYGFIADHAIHFKALQVYIEHRYYGESVPFGSIEEVMNNPEARGYFNSAQALADYAEIILQVRNDYGAHKSPVIVVGGSYGGMLASWFRLKYPHMALGALASSAPVLYFDDLVPHDGYYTFVTKEYRDVSESCYETIRDSWSEINKVADEENGLWKLHEKFHTCSSIDYPVTKLCRAIDGAPIGSDTLDRIFASVVAYVGQKDCYINEPNNFNTSLLSVPLSGWGWQKCSEMVMPMYRSNATMFEPERPFNLTVFIKNCNATYGVLPRPNWVPLYYGLYDMKLVLKNFGSNIIFSNGLKDPYSIGGVLESISDSILAIHTANGSHCLDIEGKKESDPEWLVKQRETIVKIIEAWIAKYYQDVAVEAFTKHDYGKKIALKAQKTSHGGIAQ